MFAMHGSHSLTTLRDKVEVHDAYSGWGVPLVNPSCIAVSPLRHELAWGRQGAITSKYS